MGMPRPSRKQPLDDLKVDAMDKNTNNAKMQDAAMLINAGMLETERRMFAGERYLVAAADRYAISKDYYKLDRHKDNILMESRGILPMNHISESYSWGTGSMEHHVTGIVMITASRTSLREIEDAIQSKIDRDTIGPSEVKCACLSNDSYPTVSVTVTYPSGIGIEDMAAILKGIEKDYAAAVPLRSTNKAQGEEGAQKVVMGGTPAEAEAFRLMQQADRYEGEIYTGIVDIERRNK